MLVVRYLRETFEPNETFVYLFRLIIGACSFALEMKEKNLCAPITSRILSQ